MHLPAAKQATIQRIKTIRFPEVAGTKMYNTMRTRATTAAINPKVSNACVASNQPEKTQTIE